MKLPNAEHAVVSPEKVSNYLMAKEHVQNKGKAAFFEMIGFSKVNPSLLSDQIKQVAVSGKVTKKVVNTLGVKYVVVGIITAPNGRVYTIDTVWIILSGEIEPRLVTAYPD